MSKLPSAAPDPISQTKPAAPPARSPAARHAQAIDYGQRVVAAEHAVDAESQAKARRPVRSWADR